MTERERELLIERVTGAWRGRDSGGRAQAHPAWHDLDDEGRREAFEATLQLRAMESALDPEGLSSTARLVLERIRAGGR